MDVKTRVRVPDEYWSLNLFTLEEGIKHKASVGEHVLWESVLLLHAARIRMVGFAHVWIGDIVT